MMMEVVSTSETSVNFYQTKWRYNPEDSHLHPHKKSSVLQKNFKELSIIHGD
jgi:hypothetical protein